MIAPARRAAHQVLRAVHTGRSDLGTALERARRPLRDPRDRALAGEIVLGVCRWRATVDHLLDQVATRPLARIDAAVLDVLRAAVYQLRHLTRVPARAVVDDAVALTREIGAGAAAGFVNAVLRAMADDRRPLALPALPADTADRDAALDYLSVTLSHPRWLVERWLDRHGFAAAAAWARFDNRPAPTTLRPALDRTSTAELRAALETAGVRTVPTRLARHGLVVVGGHPARTSLAAAGHFLLQDEGAQLIVDLVAATPGERVLDLCAAPGGKTVGLAAAVGERGVVVAADHRHGRVRLLAATVARCATRAAVVQLDATAPIPFGPVFDRVLVDAPCTGLGTIRRDPDIRWRRTPADLPALAARQGAMLAQAATVVRPGGRLVYATCSSEPEENDDVVARFLRAQPDFALEPPAGAVPATLIDPAGYLRTLPFRDGVEAFFGAVLTRRIP